MLQLVWPASCLHVADRSLFWYLSSGVANVHSNSKRTTKYVFLQNKRNFSIFRRQKFKYGKIWGFYHDQRLLQFYERLYILCILIFKKILFFSHKKNYIFRYISGAWRVFWHVQKNWKKGCQHQLNVILHCPKNYLNLSIKTEPVRADAIGHVWFMEHILYVYIF